MPEMMSESQDRNEGSGEDRNLVYLSSCDADAMWRDNLIQASIASKGERIDWWFPERFQGEQPAEPEDEPWIAVRRARVAVVLLSPEYLESLRGEHDLALLEQVLGERPELQIIPILVADCRWQEYTFLARFQARKIPRPTGKMSSSSVAGMLVGIIAEIRGVLAGMPPDNLEKSVETSMFSASSSKPGEKGGPPAPPAKTLEEAFPDSSFSSSSVPSSEAEEEFPISQEGDQAGGLVFLSSSLSDTSWRNRLVSTSRNDERWPQLNWWYRSRGLEQADGERESYAAIRQAKVAVILLSPAYLESSIAQAELGWLQEERRFRKLALVGVLLKNCAWRDYPVLRESQIFSASRPLAEVSDALAATELAQVIDAVASVEGVAPIEKPQGLVFSSSAKDVLRTARRLADQSRRPNITSTCLLFAFAERAGSRTDTARFVKDALNRNGRYASLFKQFLEEFETPSPGETVAGWEGTFSHNARAILEHASVISESVSHGSRLIHARHLFGALLATPVETLPTARILMIRIGLDPVSLSAEFLRFIAGYAGGDAQERWRFILGSNRQDAASPLDTRPDTQAEMKPASPFVAGTAGYTSEFCGMGGEGKVPDHLGVEGLAHRLAELIALKETKLPLAIALFGNWGSGKSHFMNLMDRHMKALPSMEADPASQYYSGQAEGWCKEIVPVYFNAWHYSDSNLWASLVTEVFDALFRKLAPKTDELALLQERLREAGGVTTLAVAEVAEAALGVQQANETFEHAKKRSEQARILLSLADGLKTILPELNTEQNRKQVEELLGVSVDEAVVSDLEKKKKELQSLSGRVKELWRRVTKPDGRWVRLAWFAGVALAIVLIRLGAAHVPWIEEKLRQMGPVARWLIGGVLATITWLTPFLRQAREGLGQLEQWQTKAERAQEKQPAKERVRAAQTGLDEAEKRARKAEDALKAAQLREQQLMQQADQLRPERRLSNFIEARARSADYRGQLGLVSLARRDFQQLTEIFTDAEALQQRLESSPPETKGVEVALNASVDRVVLYIDDLDRCEPEKVVDVLQAVHLLLAYRLFAVVVGVDQRCLRQSLKIRFKGLLTPDAAHSAAGLMDPDDVPATPLDYLEKIFHIPFHLPPMDKEGFEVLVEQLTEPEKTVQPQESATTDTSNKATGDAVKATGILPPRPSLAPPGAPLPGDSADKPAGAPSVMAPSPDAWGGVGEGAKLRIASIEASEEKTEAPAKLRVGSVPLQRWERDALKEYHTLIRTPRGATRLLNTYRLVRANLPADDWDRFRADSGGEGQARLAMLFLAVAAGQPAIARTWFATLRQIDAGSWALPEFVSVDHAAEWKEFKRLCAETSKQMTVPLEPNLIVRWLDAVERFSF